MNKNPTVKTKTLKEKHKANEDAYNYWLSNPTLSLTEVSNKHDMSCQKLRAWIKKHNKKRPDSDRIISTYAKKEVIVKAYNKALSENLTAQQASKIATDEHGKYVRKDEIQYYAVKHDLPLLPEQLIIKNW